jgi:hypothetical protein
MQDKHNRDNDHVYLSMQLQTLGWSESEMVIVMGLEALQQHYPNNP